MSIKGNFSWGFQDNNTVDEKEQSNMTAEELVKKKKSDSDEEKAEPKELLEYVTLKEIDIKIKKGEFICIVGDVGSGKTSLLQSIIGDMIYLVPE